MATRLLPDFASIVNQLGIDDHDRLRSYIKPAMYARAEESEENYPLGASRFGGQPDLPGGVAWPACDAGPIPFVAQVNLSELPSSPGRELLPERGILYFFYGAPEGELLFPDNADEADGGVEVLFAEDVRSLTRADLPDGLDEEFGVMEETQLLHFYGCNTFVDSEHPVWSRYDRQFGPDLPELEMPWEGKYSRFQILGHPAAMQSSVCGYVADEPLSRVPEQREAQIEWALGLETLFQAIDAVGDCSLYFMIQRADLLARRWDKHRWTLQCT
jgi:hypothetical protein